MRIPLDYYRILSIPIKASHQQLEQAYSDRLQQEPRREFNQYAIEARQALIQKAYQVLSDSEARAEYDAQFLFNMEPVEPLLGSEISENNSDNEQLESVKVIATAEEELISELAPISPTIEIIPSQFIGALIIMQELGEYELVLTQGIEYYNSQEFSQFKQQNSAEINIATQENIILVLALAYMELGREQWHRKEYEPAARSSQLGIDILNQENVFPSVKQELELDLYKLRPYRVLELISQNQSNSAPRARGFHLLQEMLRQRGGIEGKGEDYSGLSFDQFLCFIQQLRTYLTSVEQKQLFDQDSNHDAHDSAIGSYLAVYALLGQGFTGKKPELILRAQRKLDYLSEKQDVTWEQAVCALLLGHTEKALNKVHQTQDTSKLNQILQHAPDSADLLPGLCFYAEKWLHEDVMAQFIDLVEIKLTLKEYFADWGVQTYLDQLSPSTVLVMAETTTPASGSSKLMESKPESKENGSHGIGVLSRWRSIFNDLTTSETVVSANQVIQNSRSAASATATIERKTNGSTHEPKHKVKPSKSKLKSRAKHKHNSSKSLGNYHGNKASRSISLPLEKKQSHPCISYL